MGSKNLLVTCPINIHHVIGKNCGAAFEAVKEVNITLIYTIPSNLFKSADNSVIFIIDDKDKPRARYWPSGIRPAAKGIYSEMPVFR
jgi:hypothetical protein